MEAVARPAREATLAPAHVSRFGTRPLLVLWETTRACLLACRHCRAKAQRQPLPGELTTEQGQSLLQQIRDFGSPLPVVVFTGGDLLMRQDIFALLRHAHTLGLTTAVSPAATPLLHSDSLAAFAQAHVRSLSLSLDGTEGVHDHIRGVPGTYRRTLSCLRAARRLGLAVQVNTVVMRSTAQHLAEVAALLRREEVPTWEVFFLVPTGRAHPEELLSPAETEDVLHFLLDVTRYGVHVRVVEGPFVRRALAELRGGQSYRGGALYQRLRADLTGALGLPPLPEPRLAPFGTLDGDGVVFVAYDGTVYPGGLLPWAVGDVKEEPLPRIYRENPLLQAIRARRFAGPCGRCPFRDVCGGSRARAYALTGDPLHSDPSCPYAANL